MTEKQNSSSHNTLIGAAMFMYAYGQTRLLHITGQMRNEERGLPKKLSVTIGDKDYLCEYSPDQDVIKISYKGGSLTIKSSWNPASDVFTGEIDGKKVTNLKILEKNSIGNYTFEQSGKESSVVVRLPRAAELEKFKPVIVEMKSKPKVAASANSSQNNEQIAAAIVASYVKKLA